ncbi:MAG TPA: hypothetical protein VLV86_06015 [Vicinamibacterales bacterium]|nr:hypothetical protein [Vicinamibacterales bacterium]
MADRHEFTDWLVRVNTTYHRVEFSWMLDDKHAMRRIWRKALA